MDYGRRQASSDGYLSTETTSDHSWLDVGRNGHGLEREGRDPCCLFGPSGGTRQDRQRSHDFVTERNAHPDDPACRCRADLRCRQPSSTVGRIHEVVP